MLKKDAIIEKHIIPQSTFGSAAPMVSDAHFITPTDGKVNGQRSNYPHGTVVSTT
jgi:endonuclease I